MGATLDTYRSTALWELERILAGPAGADRDALVAWRAAITERQHVVAVATLLVDGDREPFFAQLLALAENGRRISARFAAARWAPPPASASLPLLAALAAADFDGAAALARQARGDWAREDGEYEDELLWAATLQALAASDAPDVAACEARLLALEVEAPKLYLERLGVARALLAKDGRAFSRALLDARLAYEEQIDEQRRELGSKGTDFPARAGLWLEGLAFIRLAERAGLALERVDLRFLPAIAQGPVRVVAPSPGLVAPGLVAPVRAA